MNLPDKLRMWRCRWFDVQTVSAGLYVLLIYLSTENYIWSIIERLAR